MRIPKVQLLIEGNGSHKVRKRFFVDDVDEQVEVEGFPAGKPSASAPTATVAAPSEPGTRFNDAIDVLTGKQPAGGPAVSTAAPKPVSSVNYSLIRCPAERAKAMWADDAVGCREQYDSVTNLEADLRYLETQTAAELRRQERRERWNANVGGCQREYDSFESFRAAVQHRCE